MNMFDLARIPIAGTGGFESAGHPSMERFDIDMRHARTPDAVARQTDDIARDVKNLLTIIMAPTDLLKRPDLTDEQRIRCVGGISDMVARATKLTGRLLAPLRRETPAHRQAEARRRAWRLHADGMFMELERLLTADA